MLAFYPQIKHVHIALALGSGALFAVRSLAALAGMRWPRAAPVRYLSYTIDSALLTAAMMLLTILPGAMYANGWLAMKLTMLVAYVVLGVLAMRPARRLQARALCFGLALLCYLQIYCIARTHHPLGVFVLLG